MHEDIVRMIEVLNNLSDRIEQFSQRMTMIMDRGNKPTISMVNSWQELSQESVQAVTDMQVLGDRLMADPYTPSEEDVQALLVSQSHFREVQDQHGHVIRRLKKTLGMIP